MRTVKPLSTLTLAERVNFLVTNRLPRQAATRFMGWFSRIEQPLVRALSMRVWRLFVDDLRLDEAAKSDFRSLHDCFVRELKPGSRTVDPDPDVLVSPCDAVVGAYGRVDGVEAIQAKGFPYSIAELLGDEADAERLRDGRFVTLRLKSSMYHRFHAPCAARVHEVRFLSGDTWNVNPIALKVVERLFCRNERAVLHLEVDRPGEAVTLVPVAAILVASLRIHGLPAALNLDYAGPERIPCRLRFDKGDEIGWFEHGSTIVLFATPGFEFVDTVTAGRTIRMGEALMRRRNDIENAR